MADFFKTVLGYLSLNDDTDDDYDDYEDEDEELERLERERSREVEQARREERAAKRQAARAAKQAKAESAAQAEESAPRRTTRFERTPNNKIVPIRTTFTGLEVCIMKPTSFEDSQDICDMLLTGRAVIVNLEGFDADDAQRIMDFISGSVYAISGKLRQISRYIFIFSPDNIDISGEYMDLVSYEGINIPKLDKDL